MARTLSRQEIEQIATIHAVPPAAFASPSDSPLCMMTAAKVTAPEQDTADAVEESPELGGLAQLLAGHGLQTETGYCPAGTALTQILLLPGLIILWGVAAVVIAALVG